MSVQRVHLSPKVGAVAIARPPVVGNIERGELEKGGWSTMWFLKACPRCHGDLVFDEDHQGAYLICVQCSHILSLAQERALGVRVHRHGVSPLNAHAHSARTASVNKREAAPLVAAR